MPLTPFATPYDVEYRIGRDLTSPELARIGVLLEDVSAAIRSEAGQQISRGTSTVRVSPVTGKLHLPQHPIVAITSVQDVDGNDIEHSWHEGWPSVVVAGGALVNSFEINIFTFSTPARPVTVVYEHGYDPVPDDIKGLSANVAARAFGMVPSDSGVSSESLGAYSVSYGSAAAAGGFGFLNAELAVIRRYQRPRRPISML